MQTHKSKGKFLVIEGIDGAGKSLQTKILQNRLETHYGIACLATREPGGSPLAEKIRELLLQQVGSDIDAITEALLFNAARRDHLRTVIAPALTKGLWVLCDRFVLSSFAYQGAGGASAEALETLHRVATSSNTESVCATNREQPYTPDLGLLLDLPTEQALQRVTINRQQASANNDSFESRDHQFFSRVRDTFLEHAQRGQALWSIIDARKSIECVAEAIEQQVVSRFSLKVLASVRS